MGNRKKGRLLAAKERGWPARRGAAAGCQGKVWRCWQGKGAAGKGRGVVAGKEKGWLGTRGFVASNETRWLTRLEGG